MIVVHFDLCVHARCKNDASLDDQYEPTPFTPTPSAQSPKSSDMLSPLCVRRMLSAMVGLTSMVTSFEHAASCSFWGTVLVTCGNNA